MDFCLIPYPRPVSLTFQPQICHDIHSTFLFVVPAFDNNACVPDEGVKDNFIQFIQACKYFSSEHHDIHSTFLFVVPAFDNNACVPNILRQPDTGGVNAKVAWLNPTAIDKNGVAAAVTCSPESGSSFTGFETDVNCLATDGTNTSTCKFKVSVSK